jgi:hypothetical protein
MELTMKILLTLFLTFTFLSGCASAPIAQDEFPVTVQRAAVVFDSVNSKIWGDAWSSDKPMTDFNLTRYKEFLATLKSEKAKELRENLESYDTQVLRGFEKTFVFCIFSAQLGFAMCDDARCSTVEKQALTTTPDIIETWLKELPLANCPKH